MPSAITNLFGFELGLCSASSWGIRIVKMCSRYLGFFLLVWFPGALHGKRLKFTPRIILKKNLNTHTYYNIRNIILLLICVSAQSAALHCPAPSLDHGFFVPVEETYSHDSKLTYACRNPHKPAVEGWWAESVCQNGNWSHTPRCIGTFFTN